MPGCEAARQAAGAPIPSGMNSYPSRGRLEVVPGGYGAAPALAPVRDGSAPRAHLLWAAVALLLEVIADDAPGDLDAPGEAGLIYELAGLLGGAKKPALPSAGPPGLPGPGEPLTASETRVLRYLPTHMGAPEIAAELYLSPNAVKTHLQHLYRKLGAHSRQEAVQRAQAIGLLTASSRRS
jgi:DNA-binding CsgD family transcriptional regulator